MAPGALIETLNSLSLNESSGLALGVALNSPESESLWKSSSGSALGVALNYSDDSDSSPSSPSIAMAPSNWSYFESANLGMLLF